MVQVGRLKKLAFDGIERWQQWWHRDREQSGRTCPRDLKKAKASPLYLLMFGPSVDDASSV